jgi:biotin operon repressor
MSALSKCDRLGKEGDPQVIYESSLAIGQRLADVLTLIRTGRHSTRTLAVAVGVSEPTISRCLAALRRRGYQIESRRREQGWCYVLIQEPADVPVANH